ncbi:MAG: type I-U CRISPR-associated protein Cas5/Cas6, partial [Betaproteobacteria bacterium]|nr:type I-U CRISPR-associated protein Cas5/Cas6 [Betaproteobacteria bacterium]
MFSLGIRYLMGWAMAAADGAKKERAEWPPHPDRVFMALAAAWFETGKEDAEGEVLRWLECLPAPKLCVSGSEPRQVVTHFVPVNDTSSPFEDEKKGKLAMPSGELQLGRPRRPRTFPVAIPHDPDVHLIWDEAIPQAHLEPLEALCRKVGAIGHSASLVQMWLDDTPPAASLVPVSGVAAHRLRVFGPGRLAYLEARYNRDKAIAYADLEAQAKNAEKKEKTMLQGRIKTEFPAGRPASLRPEPGLWQGYAPPEQAAEPEPIGSVFDSRLVVLTLSGKRLPLPATLKLTEALRGALLKACPQPIPEWVSGHDADGRASS